MSDALRNYLKHCLYFGMCDHFKDVSALAGFTVTEALTQIGFPPEKGVLKWQ